MMSSYLDNTASRAGKQCVEHSVIIFTLVYVTHPWDFPKTHAEAGLELLLLDWTDFSNLLYHLNNKHDFKSGQKEKKLKKGVSFLRNRVAFFSRSLWSVFNPKATNTYASAQQLPIVWQEIRREYQNGQCHLSRNRSSTFLWKLLFLLHPPTPRPPAPAPPPQDNEGNFSEKKIHDW